MRALHHHFQATPVTCGPAVARMLLERRRDMLLPEQDLARLFGTDRGGTRPHNLAAGLEGLGLRVQVHHDPDLDAMRAALATSDVVVCYSLPEDRVDHYAILTAIADQVTLCDPLFGPAWKLPVCCFTSRMEYPRETPEASGGWWLQVS